MFPNTKKLRNKMFPNIILKYCICLAGIRNLSSLRNLRGLSRLAGWVGNSWVIYG